MLEITEIKDKARERKIYLSSGNILTVTQTDPYGLWVISSERGGLPPSLKQTFTEFEYAKRAIEVMVQNSANKREVVGVAETEQTKQGLKKKVEARVE